MNVFKVNRKDIRTTTIDTNLITLSLFVHCSCYFKKKFLSIFKIPFSGTEISFMRHKLLRTLSFNS